MKPKLVKPENVIKKKTGEGGFRAEDIANAQAMIENNDIDFRPAGARLLDELQVMLADIAGGATEPGNYFNDLMYPLMQLKAQGGMFRYPAVSHVTHLIIDFLERIPAIDGAALEIVAAYLKSARAMLALQVQAVEAPASRQLYQALADACARHARTAPSKSPG